MAPTLVVLAAGVGSRYGGLKQVDPVGPSGETVMDYAVFDALRGGFGRIVFVIRRDFEALFREKVGAKYAGNAAVDYAFQEIDDIPTGLQSARGAARSLLGGREKPWGTAHAVWCARSRVRGNFAVINADDFYGADSFARLARFLETDEGVRPMMLMSSTRHQHHRSDPFPERFAMVGFRLANTLSEHGTVARGICTAASGRLVSVEERTGISPTDVGPGRTYTGEEIVSMNCWGFTPALFPALESRFAGFLAARAGEPKAEFYLPAAVSAMVEGGSAIVDVLPTASSWFGVTYRDDKARVQAAIANLVRRGEYPERLF